MLLLFFLLLLMCPPEAIGSYTSYLRGCVLFLCLFCMCLCVCLFVHLVYQKKRTAVNHMSVFSFSFHARRKRRRSVVFIHHLHTKSSPFWICFLSLFHADVFFFSFLLLICCVPLLFCVHDVERERERERIYDYTCVLSPL